MHYDEVALLSRLASPDVLSPGDVYNLPMLFPTQELDLMQFLRNKVMMFCLIIRRSKSFLSVERLFFVIV